MSNVAELSKLSEETRDRVHRELQIKLEPKFGLGPIKYIYPFTLRQTGNGGQLVLPFAYASRALRIERPLRSTFPASKHSFNGTLREEQKIARKEAVKMLNTRGSALLALYCGFGKTFLSINIATSIGLRTLVIVNKVVLMKQWESSIGVVCPEATVRRLTPRSKKEDASFYIMNAQNIEKMPPGFFNDVGTVIVDEAHMIMAETLSRSLQHVHPRYLMGLTATPYRPDGLDILLRFYFGRHMVVRKLFCEHTVYKVETGFKPTVERTMQGRVNWGSVLDSQANDERRNELIVELITGHEDRNFLVLVKRVAQGQYLVDRLKELDIKVTNLMGSKQEYEESARVLVGTCQKVGVGFDHPKLNALILAADVEEYFIQYLGRVFRTKEVRPIVFDLVDDNSILRKHFATRKRVYEEHGGTIVPFDDLT